MSPMIIHVSAIEDVDALPSGTDLRTKSGRDAEMLAKIRQDGGFSAFWIGENLKRCYALERLERLGVIARSPTKRPFPWCAYEDVTP